MVIVFLNPDIPEALADVSPAWPLDRVGAIATEEGAIYNATFIAGDAVRIGYPIIAHEIGHLFGLIDLYDYQWQVDNPTNDWLRQFKFTGIYDFMNWANASDWGDNRDMLAWQRYLLDWITDEQVRCVDRATSSVTTHLLAPSHEDSPEHKMVVVPLTNTSALVVEVKDRNLYCIACNGGVYTYVIDTAIYNGQGPIRMVRPEHSQMDLFQDAYLKLGQQVTYENITIEYVDDFVYPIVQVTVE
jgi:M6 family metalloprotease-like protein